MWVSPRRDRRGERPGHVPGSFPKRLYGQWSWGRGGADPRSAAEHRRGGGGEAEAPSTVGAGSMETPRPAQAPLRLRGGELAGWGRVGAAAPEGDPPSTPCGDWGLTVAPPGCAQSQVCRTKINKNRCNGEDYETCWIVIICVKLFLFIYFFYFFLGKGGFGWDQGLGEGRRLSLGLPAAAQGPCRTPSRANFPERLLGVRRGRRVPGAFGFRTRLSFAPHCAHFREQPPSSRISPVHHSHTPGAAPPPLPRALPGALNNDICMQGAIHKYVRAGEI